MSLSRRDLMSEAPLLGLLAAMAPDLKAAQAEARVGLAVHNAAVWPVTTSGPDVAAAERAESRLSTQIHRHAQRLDDLVFRAESAFGSQIRQRQRHTADLTAAVLRHDPRQALAQAREQLMACRTRLHHSIERLLYSSGSTLGALDARLHSLSPLAVLDRGYALVLDAAGTLVRSATQVATGDRLTTRLADGTFTSRVEDASPTKGRSRTIKSKKNQV